MALLIIIKSVCLWIITKAQPLGTLYSEIATGQGFFYFFSLFPSRFSIVRYTTAEQAEAAINTLNGIHIDAQHQTTLEKVDVSVRYHQARVIIPGLEEQLSLLVPLDVTRELHSQG